jgi:DNA relaxase NicK
MIDHGANGSRLIDHIAFTVKDDSAWPTVESILCIKWAERGFGGHLYKESADGDIPGSRLYHEGVKADMGHFVQLSGQSCRFIESQENFPGWIEYLKKISDAGAIFRRVDVTVDDIAGKIDYETVAMSVRDKALIRARGTCWGEIISSSKGVKHRTLTIGSRTSTAMIRVYDKGLQTGCRTSWLRFEFELKKERAEAWVNVLISEGWDVAYGSLRGILEFLDPDHKTTDRSRHRAAQWWIELIAASRNIIKISSGAIDSIEKAIKWVNRQWTQTIAVLVEVNEGDTTWLYDLMENGRKRYKKKHRLMIEQARRVNYEVCLG